MHLQGMRHHLILGQDCTWFLGNVMQKMKRKLKRNVKQLSDAIPSLKINMVQLRGKNVSIVAMMLLTLPYLGEHFDLITRCITNIKKELLSERI
mmetsp:Transcript_4150/g.4545  ORF Transcript_4150/g.4545 Transcript_4150/m.4545 type:complete len:94 (+) Transcript_4150:1480-1761(+)